MENKELNALIEQAIGKSSRNGFCRRAGISAGNLSRIMRGQKPSPEILERIAQSSVLADYAELMRAAGYIEAGQAAGKGIPIVGSIAAGSPIEAAENFSGYLKIEYGHKQMDKDCLALNVVGDSMDLANIPDGSMVIVRRQDSLKDGDIGAVMVNGEVTVKKVYRKGSYLMLTPVSSKPVYAPQIYSSEDEVRILGKVILTIVDME